MKKVTYYKSEEVEEVIRDVLAQIVDKDFVYVFKGQDEDEINFMKEMIETELLLTLYERYGRRKGRARAAKVPERRSR
jgi:hypothetical protein